MTGDVFEKYGVPEEYAILTQREMAELLGINVRTLIRWDKDRSLIARRKPNGQPFYIKQDYYDYIKRGQERGEAQNV